MCKMLRNMFILLKNLGLHTKKHSLNIFERNNGSKIMVEDDKCRKHP